MLFIIISQLIQARCRLFRWAMALISTLKTIPNSAYQNRNRPTTRHALSTRPTVRVRGVGTNYPQPACRSSATTELLPQLRSSSFCVARQRTFDPSGMESSNDPEDITVQCVAGALFVCRAQSLWPKLFRLDPVGCRQTCNLNTYGAPFRRCVATAPIASDFECAGGLWW